nr:permease [Anaerolineae bacterium]
MKLTHQTPLGPASKLGVPGLFGGLRDNLAPWKNEGKALAVISSVFVLLYFIPLGNTRFDNAVMESLYLAQWYAREHVLLCLIPAFFIAGGVSVFVSQASVMKYLGANAPKGLAYGVAAVFGSILAVCSCT